MILKFVTSQRGVSNSDSLATAVEEESIGDRPTGPRLRNVQGFLVTDARWELLLAFAGGPEAADTLLD